MIIRTSYGGEIGHCDKRGADCDSYAFGSVKSSTVGTIDEPLYQNEQHSIPKDTEQMDNESWERYEKYRKIIYGT
jgi:hypothetical protein